MRTSTVYTSGVMLALMSLGIACGSSGPGADHGSNASDTGGAAATSAGGSDAGTGGSDQGTGAGAPGTGGSHTGVPPVELNAAFPLFAVVSPFARASDSAGSSGPPSGGGAGTGLRAFKNRGSESLPHTMDTLGAKMSEYEELTAKVAKVLTGEIPVNQAFDPHMFLSQSHDAGCFGPMLKYANHPDYVPPAGPPDGPPPPDAPPQPPPPDAGPDGTLPPGDLGMWLETDGVTGDACAVAELGSRITVLRDQSLASMTVLASLVAVTATAGKDLPAPGDSLDVTAEMNAAGVPNVVFNSATITQASEGEWTYTTNFTFNSDKGPFDTEVRLAHNVGTDSDHYTGTLSYWVEATSEMLGGNNCPDPGRTLNGSLAYARNGVSDLKFQSRTATFCGSGANGFVADAADPANGQVDFSQSFDQVDNPDGWSDNANLFVADFSPTDLDGSYVYAWQAGAHDSNTRVFNIGLNGETSDGEAFFGFGDPMWSTNGTVKGFYCNWAASGPDKVMHQYAQRQFVSFDTTTSLYNAVSSEIAYAPTNSCEYDGSGDFVYDTNLNGDLSDESPFAATVGLADTDYGGTVYATISEVIEQRRTPPDASTLGGWPSD